MAACRWDLFPPMCQTELLITAPNNVWLRGSSKHRDKQDHGMGM